jgi:hypothetical protein
MAYNDRIENSFKDVDYGQLAPSKEFRTEYYPGKAVSRPGDMNWEKDYKIPVGTPVFAEAAHGPVNMTRVRVVKLGRNIVCDQVLVSVPALPGKTTQVNDGRKERTSGYDKGEQA